MLKKHQLINRILEEGVVAIVRTNTVQQAEKAVEACMNGGLRAIELTFTMNQVPEAMKRIRETYGDEICLGAGSVLDSETARAAILAGASYIISPSFDRATALLCNRYGVPYMPGCYTPTEIVQALEYGVDVVKLFPSSLLSPKAISALGAPLPQANIMPTGGVNLDNVEEWFSAGAVALGVGGDLMAGVKTEDYQSVTEKAKAYKTAVATARKKLNL